MEGFPADGGRIVLGHVSCRPEHYRSHLVDELEEAIRADGEKILEHATRVAEEAGVQAEARLLEKDHAAEALQGPSAEDHDPRGGPGVLRSPATRGRSPRALAFQKEAAPSLARFAPTGTRT